MKSQETDRRKIGLKILTVIYAAIFIAILALAYQGNLPAGLTQNDKLAHFVLYGIATFLGQRVFHDRHLRLFRLRLPLFPALFGLFTIVEETMQGFSPNRSLDELDLIASLVGIWLGYWLAKRWQLR